MEPQPAIKSYFFGKGYTDLVNTIRDCWSMNLVSAAGYWQKTMDFWDQEFPAKILCIATAFAAFSVVAFGTVWFLILSAVHIAVLGAFFLLIYISFTVLWVIERTYMLGRGIFTACPVCHVKADLPHYLCPGCKTVHTRLIPSGYGIVRRTCMCGQKLPTTFFQRRWQLKDYARCPNPDCSHSIEAAESKPICIPIVGGPSVGKTCYLFAATRELLSGVVPRMSWQARFLNPQNEAIYQQGITAFDAGHVPVKTATFNPTAFNFFVSSTRWSLQDRLIYLYDAAGEVFRDSHNLVTHHFYGYLHGFIFIIDPFSIPELLEEYSDNLKLYEAQIKPSDILLDETFDIMLMNLEKNHNIRREEQIKKPCAIIINKVDAFDLDDRIGERAAWNLLLKRQDLRTAEAAVDALCKDLFQQWGLGNFLRKLDQKFKTYRFFTCSALGRIPDGSDQSFKPYRVMEPLIWILSQADSNIARDLRLGEQ